MTDAEVWRTDIALADLAEPLGFDSVWTVEHHFSRYAMTPDPLQFLTYMAGRTSRVQLGSMVAVLPWHDPVRIAENVLVLDHLSGGRLLLGIGRGTGPVEFTGLRVPMDTARLRFKEMTEALVMGLETGVIEYDGELVRLPRVELHPEPMKSFKDRIYSATISPESAEIMAQLGTGVLVIPQKPWHLVDEEIQAYCNKFRTAIGHEPPQPIVAGWTLVDADPDRARERARQYLGGYWRSVVEHYGFDKPLLKSMKGYEFHSLVYDRLMEPGGMDAMTNFYVELQGWGTPERVYERIKGFTELVGSNHFVGVFRYAGMTPEEGEANIRLFAKEVMPELQKLEVKPKVLSAAEHA